MKKIVHLLIAALFLNLHPTAAQNQCGDQLVHSCTGTPYYIPYQSTWNAEPYKPGWKLIFNDEFNGGALDLTKWKITEGKGKGNPEPSYWDDQFSNLYTDGGTSTIFERHYNKKENVVVDGGLLHIKLIKEDAIANYSLNGNTLYHKYKYTSGDIHTRDNYGYGYCEVRCKLPKGESFWPAVWMWGGSPNNEIDIYENVNLGKPQGSCDDILGHRDLGLGSHMVGTNIHMDNPNNFPCADYTNQNCDIPLSLLGDYNTEQFYTVAMDWQPDEIRWYVNGHLGRVVKKGNCDAFPTNPMALIMGCAIEGWSEDRFLPYDAYGAPLIGGCHDQTPFPAEFQIDYIRYYQKECSDKDAMLYQSIGNVNTIVNDFCFDKGYTDMNTHPRLVADFNGDGKADIAGFKDHTYVALSNYQNNEASFIYNTNNQTMGSLDVCFGTNGSWTTQNLMPRLTGDFNGDGKADLIGFNATGTKAAYSSCDPTNASFAINGLTNTMNAFGISQHYINQERHPRMIADIDGDGYDDIIGFANRYVFVSLSLNAPNYPQFSFPATQISLSAFVPNFGYGSMENHPRFLADVNGDQLPDIVGFANDGTYVSLNKSTPGVVSFILPVKVLNNFGVNHGYPSQTATPRLLADVNGDGKMDIVGFGQNYVDVALSTSGAAASYSLAQIVLSDFCSNSRWCNNNMHTRMMSDVNCDGKADIVGFWDGAVMVSLSRTDIVPNSIPNFANYQVVTDEFSVDRGWNDQNVFPRMLTEIKGDCSGKEIIGFGYHDIRVFDCLSSLCSSNDITNNTCFEKPDGLEFTELPEENQFFPITYENNSDWSCTNQLYVALNPADAIFNSTYTDAHGTFVYIKGYFDPVLFNDIRCQVYNNDALSSTYIPSPTDCQAVGGETNIYLCENPVLPYINTSSGNKKYFEMRIPINSAQYNICSTCTPPLTCNAGVASSGMGPHNCFSTCSEFIAPKLKEWRFDIEVKQGSTWSTAKTIQGMVCGDLYIVHGQSNAVACPLDDANLQTYEDDLNNNQTSRFMRSYGPTKGYADGIPMENWGGWNKPSAFWWSSAFSGVIGLRLQENIVINKHIPVGIINAAVGGTQISEHLRDADPIQATLDAGYNQMGIYRHMLYQLNNAGQNVLCNATGLINQVRGIIWYQGEADTFTEDNVCHYAENFRNFYTSLVNDLKDPMINNVRRNTKIYMFQLNTFEYHHPFGLNYVSRIRETQRQLAEKYHNAFLADELNNTFDVRIMSTVGTDISDRSTDGVHYQTSGYKKLGDKIYNMINHDFYDTSIPADMVEPPHIVKAYYDDLANPGKIILDFDIDVTIPSECINGTYCLRNHFLDENENVIPLLSCQDGPSSKQITLELDRSLLPPPYPGYTVPFKKISYLPSGRYWNPIPNAPAELYIGPWIVNKNNHELGALTFHQFPLGDDHDGATDHWTPVWKNNGDGYIGKWQIADNDVFCIADFDGEEGDEIFIKAESDVDHRKLALLKYNYDEKKWDRPWYSYYKDDSEENGTSNETADSHTLYDQDKYYSIDPDGLDGAELLVLNSGVFHIYDYNGSFSLSSSFETGLTAVSNDLISAHEITIGNFDGIDGQEIIAYYDLGTYQTIKAWRWDGSSWVMFWSNQNCDTHEMFLFDVLQRVDMNGDGRDELLGRNLNDGLVNVFQYALCPTCTSCGIAVLAANNGYDFTPVWSNNNCTSSGVSFIGSNGNNGTSCAGWQSPLYTTDKLLVGNIDIDLGGGDVKDELFFIQTGPTAEWVATMDYDKNIDQWSWNYSADPNKNLFTLNDWTLGDDGGSNTDYHLIDLSDLNNSERKSVLCLRKNACNIYNMAIYEASSNSRNYRMQDDSKESTAKSGVIQLHPVPASNLLNVEFRQDKGEKITLKIIDTFGREVLDQSYNDPEGKEIYSTTLDLSSYTNGIYFVSIETETGRYLKRFVISK